MVCFTYYSNVIMIHYFAFMFLFTIVDRVYRGKFGQFYSAQLNSTVKRYKV